MPRPTPRQAIPSLLVSTTLFMAAPGLVPAAHASSAALPAASAASAAMAMAMRAVAAPMPRAAEPRWELRFEVLNELRLVVLGGQPYWFLTYLVTNRTNQDQTFVPSAILYTDQGEILADDAVPFEVNKELLDLLRNPLLEDRNQIIGVLQQGRENAREGLLVFPAGDLIETDRISIFIAGLSSETQVAINPATGEEVIVRKSLELQYNVPGEALQNPMTPIQFTGRRWVMR